MSITPQLAVLAVLTTGVGAIMSRLGQRTGLLQTRIGRRRCPSCGRIRDTRVCVHCTND